MIPPGPSLWEAANIFIGGRDHIDSVGRLQKRFGDLVYTAIPGRKVYWFFHPDDVMTVLKNAELYGRQGSRTYEYLKQIFGQSLFTTEGETWRAQHDQVSALFSPARLKSYAPIFIRQMERIFSRWEEMAKRGEASELGSEIATLTLDITCESLFGMENFAQYQALSQALLDATTVFYHRLRAFWPAPAWWPQRWRRGQSRFEKAISTLNGIVYGIIDRRRQDPGDRHDLLAVLMKEVSDRTRLRDQILTLLSAGFGTTAATATWMLYELFRPENRFALNKLRDELAQVLQGKLPTYADYASLPYTEMVVKETLRLHPPVYLFSRFSTAPSQIRGYTIGAASLVMIPIHWLHRHPAFWTDPETFQPERFSRKSHPFAWMPFGGGRHLCTGMRFAMLELVLFLASFAPRFDLTFAQATPLESELGMVQVPKGPIPIQFHPRPAH